MKNKGYKCIKIQVLGPLLPVSLKYYVEQFWVLFMSKYDKEQLIGVLVKVYDNNGNYKCIGPLHRIHKTDMKEFLLNLQNYLNKRSDDYFEDGVERIEFHTILLK